MKTLEKIYSLFLNCNQKICIDSRYEKIKNSIFFGIKGPNFDGNLYAENALKKGAKYAIVDKNIDSQNDKIIKADAFITAVLPGFGFLILELPSALGFLFAQLVSAAAHKTAACFG